ncbi:hypothetical protein PV04_08212 [Phialophora macrospora]|uniref:Uncharacterized protein n=1 Tax=Phialophora macrospora TaxID=1851006 RepID=A0A0D2FH12_9EURO|nr:hypothetical protein PV04_08212 [Phialophora macrospora]
MAHSITRSTWRPFGVQENNICVFGSKWCHIWNPRKIKVEIEIILETELFSWWERIRQGHNVQ